MKATPETVARHYDQLTPAYMAAFGESFQAHRPSSDEEFLGYVLRRIDLAPGMPALDAGCGICGPARFFAAHSGALIEALTISKVQVERAREMNETAALTANISVKLGDFHDLVSLYGKNRFERVYFLESLSHSADPARVLRSVFDVLRPGGSVYIKDFFAVTPDTKAQEQEILAIVLRINAAFQVETARVADMARYLVDAGFERIFVEQPAFNPDLSRWQAFEKVHQFNLYNGQVPLAWVEWFELKFSKPSKM